VAQQFLDAVSHLVAFRTQGLDLPGQVRIGILGFGKGGLGRRQFLQGRVLLLPQTIDKRHRFLDALLKMGQSIDFRFLSCSCHFINLLGWGRKCGLNLRCYECELTGIGGGRFSKNLPVQFNAG